jgi:hypothetical protein
MPRPALIHPFSHHPSENSFSGHHPQGRRQGSGGALQLGSRWPEGFLEQRDDTRGRAGEVGGGRARCGVEDSAVGEGAGAETYAEVGERRGATAVEEMEAGANWDGDVEFRCLAAELRQVSHIASRERPVGKKGKLDR